MSFFNEPYLIVQPLGQKFVEEKFANFVDIMPMIYDAGNEHDQEKTFTK